MSHEILRELPLFAGLTQKDIDLLEEASTTHHLAAGDILVEQGTPSGSLYVILEGEFEIVKRSGTQDVFLAVRGAGEVIGEMSLLDQTPRTATVRAQTACIVLEIDQEAFRHLLAASPSAALSIMRTMTSRLRNTESMLRQSEKMAGLGTLAAGLAHELNNPAAALARSADQLRDALQSWEEASAGASEGAAIAATLQRWGKAGGREGGTDPLELSEREEQISEWLEHEGVSDPWDIAGGLAEAGFNLAQLAGLVADVPPADRAARVEWLSRGLAVRKLVGEIGMSAGRISEIVRAVKSYAYLDQAPIQEVDLHAGLDDTLVILRRKLEPGIQVRRAYAPGLPKIEAFGSELNQVWTNLIDNAAQAMQGQGELTLATARRGEDVEVRICDSGPGIPEAVRSRIFEPFFTTKAPGEGTGLGLHLVYNIVVLHHHGKVDVESAPGRTCFTITLPIQRPRGENER